MRVTDLNRTDLSDKSVRTVLKRRTTDLVKRSARGFLAVCLTLSFTAVAPVPAAVAAESPAYYVAVTGNDTTGAGSVSSPWKTIQKAVNTVPAGSTVHVAPGTYNERVTVPATKSGTAAAKTSVVADGAVIVSQGFVVSASYTNLTGFEVTPGGASVNYDSGQVDISGDYNTVSGFNVHHTVNGSAFAFKNGASYNIVKDFAVERPYYDGGWFYDGSDHNTMLNGTIHDFGGMEGVYMLGSSNTVDGATITGPGGWTKIWSYFGDGDGIRPWGTNLTIRNCKIYDMWPGSPEAHSDAIQFWRGQTNLLIENNIIGSWGMGGINNTRDSDAGIMMSAAEDVSITVRNNVFLGGMYYPINMNTSGAGNLTLKLYNNTFWTNGPPRIEKMPGSIIRNNIFKAGISILNPTASPGLSSDYNLYTTAVQKPAAETHSIVGDPQFVNGDISAATHYGVNADFRLKSTSPAISKADAAYATATDIVGASRVGVPDLGAYEYGGAVSPPLADTTAPTVAITAPAAGSTVSGSVALAANAADAGSGVARVEFRADGVLVGTDTTAPYAATWNATSATVGLHAIEAKVFDGAGNSAASNVTVTVPAPADTVAPTVAITAPTVGSPMVGTVDLAADASDAGSGIERVEFRADGVLIGTEVDAPYTGYWNAGVANAGLHSIEAKAFDGAGNSAVSKVTVNVPVPADITAPTTSASVDRSTGSTGWYQSAPLVSLLPSEAAVTNYQWDGLAGIWNGYTGAINAPQGTHTLYYRSTDTAGNAEIAKSITLKVDSAAPSAPSVTSATHPDPFTPDNSASAGFGFTADDGVSGVAGYSYGFDQSASTTPDTITEGTSTSASIIPGSDGVYYFHVRALDVAGNWGPTAHRQMTVDRTGPATPVIAAVPNGGVIGLAWTPASDSLSTRVLRSTAGYASNPSDPAATLIYEGASTTYSDAAVVTGTTYYYTAFSRDLAGNWSASGTATAGSKIQPQLRLSSSATSLRLNRYATLRAQYLINDVAATASAPVSVWSNASGTWSQIGVATYDSVSKSYSFRARITRTASYQFRCDADTTRNATASNSVTVQLKTTVALVTTTPTVDYGSPTNVVMTIVGPNPRRAWIQADRYDPDSNSWIRQEVATRRVATSSGIYAKQSISPRLPARGRWRLIGVVSASGVGTVSNSVYVVVR